MLYDRFATETSSISVQNIRLLPGNDARWDGWKQLGRKSASSTAKHCWKIWVWTAQCLQESCDCGTVWKTKHISAQKGRLWEWSKVTHTGRVEQHPWIWILKSQNAEMLHQSGFLWASRDQAVFLKESSISPLILTWKNMAKLKKICKLYKMFFDERDPNSSESFFEYWIWIWTGGLFLSHVDYAEFSY